MRAKISIDKLPVRYRGFGREAVAHLRCDQGFLLHSDLRPERPAGFTIEANHFELIDGVRWLATPETTFAKTALAHPTLTHATEASAKSTRRWFFLVVGNGGSYE